MNKKLITLFICIGLSVLLFSNQVSSDLDLKDTENFINKVKVKITLPDSNEAIVVIDEDKIIDITFKNEQYMFTPRIIDLEEKTAVIDNVFSSVGDAESFYFEIIDIISIPISQIKKMACECCITCESTQTKVCGCAVVMCGESCCCHPACCRPQI